MIRKLIRFIPKAGSRPWFPLFVMAIVSAANQGTARGQTLMTSSLAAVRASVNDRPATASDLAVEMPLTASLKMRNVAELEARLQRGERISPAEMTDKYYPTEEDYQKVRAWLLKLGFTDVPFGGPRLSVFVTGSASLAASALQVQFVKKQDPQMTGLMAVSAPSVPADIASLILGIDGLQPLYYSHPADGSNIFPNEVSVGDPRHQQAGGTARPYTPSQIFTAYNGNNLPNRGANQMIAIVGSVTPSSTDVSNFWSTFSIPQSLDNFQSVNVPNTSNSPITGGPDANNPEWSLDVEWASSIASSSVVKFYNCRSIAVNGNLTKAYQQIVNDLPSMPNLHQVSISLGIPEAATSSSFAQSSSNYFMSMASSGVTVFVASGDGGGRPNASTGNYDTGSPISAEVPADSPYATAVGGTTLSLDSNGLSSGEYGWSITGSGSRGSGGGASNYFKKPSWQTGSGVPNDNRRYVPDVAMVADPNPGVYIYYAGNYYSASGTSVGTPIMAGICACINEARQNFGLSALGSGFNPLAYSLIQTSGYRDLTAGTNGVVSATSGYDQITGVGAPNIATLFHASVSNNFFANEVEVGNRFYYLKFPESGNPFGYYNYDNFPHIYHNEAGYETLSTTSDSNHGVYLYDYNSGHTFYTSPTYPFPYLYDFTLQATLYYYPQQNNPDHYTTNPRYFYNTATGQTITQ